MQKEKPYDYWNFSPMFLLINTTIGTVVAIYLCPLCFLSWQGYLKIWDSHLLSVAISVAYSWGCNAIDDYFDPRISWLKQPLKRVFWQTLAYVVYLYSVAYLLIALLVLNRKKFVLAEVPWKALHSDIYLPLVVGLGLVVFFTSKSFLREWKIAAVEAEQLRSERYALQYQSLKDQLNPHFLFNSLNVLNGLVYENQDAASAFIRKLSKIYRYVLEVQAEQVVSVGREIAFARHYLDLQKIRFGEGLEFDIQISADSEHFFLPPLSLQLLLENAIKHNVASKDNPLRIRIVIAAGNRLAVCNSLRLKSSIADESTGVGLANIRKRYELLGETVPQVTISELEYVVHLPLIGPRDALTIEKKPHS